MITVLNKILEVSNDPTIEALVEILKGKVDAIDADIKSIENWSGEAYQTGDDIYNAVDSITAITHGAVVKISVIHFLADYVFKHIPKFEEQVDADFEKFQKQHQFSFPTLGKLFEHHKDIPFVDDSDKLIINNWANVDDMLNRSDDNRTYVSVKEQHKDVAILWEW